MSLVVFLLAPLGSLVFAILLAPLFHRLAVIMRIGARMLQISSFQKKRHWRPNTLPSVRRMRSCCFVLAEAPGRWRREKKKKTSWCHDSEFLEPSQKVLKASSSSSISLLKGHHIISGDSPNLDFSFSPPSKKARSFAVSSKDRFDPEGPSSGILNIAVSSNAVSSLPEHENAVPYHEDFEALNSNNFPAPPFKGHLNFQSSVRLFSGSAHAVLPPSKKARSSSASSLDRFDWRNFHAINSVSPKVTQLHFVSSGPAPTSSHVLDSHLQVVINSGNPRQQGQGNPADYNLIENICPADSCVPGQQCHDANMLSPKLKPRDNTSKHLFEVASSQQCNIGNQSG